MQHLHRCRTIFFVFACFSAYASDTTLTLYQQHKNNVNLGIIAKKLSDDSTIFAKKHTLLQTPASTTKIITAAPALELLGKEYVYKTCCFSDGYQDGETLVGNVYLKGSGDPSLTAQNIKSLAMALAAKNIRCITGNMCMDISVFDNVPFTDGASWGDGPEVWNPPVSALCVDENVVKVHVSGTQHGLSPLVTFQTMSDAIAIQNLATTKTICAEPLTVQRIFDKPTQENIISISGEIQALTQKEYTFALKKPYLHACAIFLEALQEANIKIGGTVVFNAIPEKAIEIACHTSKPLLVLIGKMLKESNNLYADCLLKTLGYFHQGQGSFLSGCDIVKEVLEKEFGIEPYTYRITDGSGRSRYNLLSPEQIVTILVAISKKPYAAAFKQALSIAGHDGTLAKRLTEFAHKVHAKTGTLGGVSALSGYLDSTTHGPCAFSILINGFVQRPSHDSKSINVKADIEDQLCKTFLS